MLSWCGPILASLIRTILPVSIELCESVTWHLLCRPRSLLMVVVSRLSSSALRLRWHWLIHLPMQLQAAVGVHKRRVCEELQHQVQITQDRNCHAEADGQCCSSCYRGLSSSLQSPASNLTILAKLCDLSQLQGQSSIPNPLCCKLA